ncbi:taurine ABC transporter substrate-binding protein [Cocleimonas flava]|jgi:taurine transport system substrate-binding protein|uniref:Taurine transport system substrate-binding protein n=1 Tax=Cocleimonas flava TaxID=634765 RepID=A0A4R1F6F4_9GAMM|nr:MULTISPECIES: ABC transporter substrate-binding protein [Cocleimonas]MEB8431461.1 ABC transporter substrate-binding protein [Cocleimonas sp. KMM 6892]MEC4713767.1 ABC transporter substrate-binding protein [Cocleimonas sp. KMM 6895]MEC4743098.1 ABC transporter substrate-binding protein [Cocleimonas sp. KMM 6896]TCJ89140.1 taurine transport system substrate-binding protein [Cocleimonas flava]
MKSMKKILGSLSIVALSASMATSASADVNVAYFLEWATPNQIAKVEKTYDKALGEKVNWVNFATGTAMTEAMLSGDIDIAFSQGLTPFVNAVNANAPIKLIGVAVAYGAGGDCVVSTKSGISKENATELEGKSIAVPLNTMSDYEMRLTLSTLGVDIKKVTLVDQEPADAAVSLVDGAVAMACGFGENSLSKMKEVGKSMLTIPEKTEAGITSFDIVSVTEKFAQENPEAVKTFMEVTAQANADFAKDQSKLAIIAGDAGLSVEKTKKQMAGFSFPSVEEQMSEYFSKDGKVASVLPFMGKMFATEAAPAKEDYSTVVDTSFLK